MGSYLYDWSLRDEFDSSNNITKKISKKSYYRGIYRFTNEEEQKPIVDDDTDITGETTNTGNTENTGGTVNTGNTENEMPIVPDEGENDDYELENQIGEMDSENKISFSINNTVENVKFYYEDINGNKIEGYKEINPSYT